MLMVLNEQYRSLPIFTNIQIPLFVLLHLISIQLFYIIF